MLAIADTRSTNRDADREHRALAAAGKPLSGLEPRPGLTLFGRPVRGAAPSEAGRALAHQVRSLRGQPPHHHIAGFRLGAAGQDLTQADTEGRGKPLKARLGASVLPDDLAPRFAQPFRRKVLVLEEAGAEPDPPLPSTPSAAAFSDPGQSSAERPKP